LIGENENAWTSQSKSFIHSKKINPPFSYTTIRNLNGLTINLLIDGFSLIFFILFIFESIDKIYLVILYELMILFYENNIKLSQH
jgi:hypothetical protein